jgi:hypothetical protein
MPYLAYSGVFNQESGLLHAKNSDTIKVSIFFGQHFNKTLKYIYGKGRFNYQ